MTCGFENQYKYMHLYGLKSSHTTRVSRYFKLTFPESLSGVLIMVYAQEIHVFNYLSGSPVLFDFGLSDSARH